MPHLLYIEWLKIKNYRTFWILLLIIIVSIPAFNYTLFDLMDNSFPKIGGKNVFGSPFGFPDVWQTVAWNSSLLVLLPAILVITLTTNEFTYKTHRQNIIDGWSRTQFISVKLVEIVLLAILSTLVVFFTTLAFGYFGNKVSGGVSIWEHSYYVLFYFIGILSYSMIAFLIATLIRRAGLSMGVFFIYMILEQVVVGFFRNRYKMDWVDYLPEEVSDRLVPQPYLQKVFANDEWFALWHKHLPVFIGVAFAYLLVNMFFVVRNFKTNDL